MDETSQIIDWQHALLRLPAMITMMETLFESKFIVTGMARGKRIILKQESMCKTSKDREHARYWRWFDKEKPKGMKPPI